MGIKKLGYNKFEIRKNYNGTEIRRIVRGSRVDAKHVLAEIEREIEAAKSDNQVWTGIEKYRGKLKTFEESAADYISALVTTKPNTVETYGSVLKTHLLPAFATIPTRAIDRNAVDKFRVALANKRQARSDKPLSTATVNQLLAVLKVVLRHAERVGDIDRAPEIRRLPKPKNDIQPFSKEELAAILDAAESDWAPVFKLLAGTGMREGEAFALTWSDVDWNREEIRISKTFSRGHATAPKTRDSNRTISLTPIALEALRELKSRGVMEIGGNIIPRYQKGLESRLSYAWNRAIKRAGIEHRPVRQLRHTFASLLLQDGVEVGWVSRQLGHSSMKTTFDYYLRFIPSTSEINKAKAASTFASPKHTHDIPKTGQ